jgi:hypothetical protein
MVIGVKSWVIVSQTTGLKVEQRWRCSEIGPVIVKEAKMVALSLVALNKYDIEGSGFGVPTPNILAKALSFKTLRDTFVMEEARNFG